MAGGALAGPPNKLMSPTIAAKLADFNFGMHPDPRTERKPGEILADNGVRVLGNNFASPLVNRTVARGFDNLLVQKNQDFLNDMGEGMIGSPGGINL